MLQCHIMKYSVLYFLLCLYLPAALADDDQLPMAQDLLQESRDAACKGQPYIVMFGSSTCPYCSVVRSLYLAPLQNDPRYPGLVIREMETDSNQRVKDFSGDLQSMSKLAASYGVSLVPQVMVFTADGVQVGKSLIGITTEDFYGYYLDEAIQAGIQAVRQKSIDAPSALPGGYACD